jgi:hypothetical protein
VNPGETGTRRYGLRQYIVVQSQPSSASVYLNDSLAGETPLLLRILPFGGGFAKRTV